MRLLPQLDVHSCPRLVILCIVEAMFSSLSKWAIPAWLVAFSNPAGGTAGGASVLCNVSLVPSAPDLVADQEATVAGTERTTEGRSMTV